MESVLNGTFASPLANADRPLPNDPEGDSLLSTIYNGVNIWNVFLAILAVLVTYDQGRKPGRANIQIRRPLSNRA